jgi:hypothetical protein
MQPAGLGAILLWGVGGDGSVISTGPLEYQCPGVAPGPQIVGLPQDVEEAYDQAGGACP